MRKLKAMTIADTIIAMVLASLVMGMGGYFYLGLVKTMKSYEETTKLAGDLQRLTLLMQTEKSRSDKMMAGENKLVFLQMNSADSLIVEYVFEGNGTVRIQNGVITDSLTLVCVRPEYSFMGNSVGPGMLCDYVFLPFNEGNNPMEIILRKKYPSSFIINQEHGN
ncbi:MAG TPA: hypothetical protein DCD96_06765 [Flavobacteriales bacterium]|nr:hypothetical protein [Flavobacteriales bacterium]HRE74728.1 hypothetical protein [Flavobacteriales bacterium]HRJ37970.1 hypothetical protein [Flavobacteriales bacterium]